MKKEEKPYIYTYLAILLVCLLFLAGSLAFVYVMMRQDSQDGLDYLRGAAVQNRIAINKQIIGDFQTLDGVAVALEGADIENPERLARVLKTINDNNTFIRMGLADERGAIEWLDIDGHTYAGNIGGKSSFQSALAGDRALAVAQSDIRPGEYTDLYCVPMHEGDEVIGALCAVNTTSMLRQIIDTPIYNDKGYSDIIDSSGRYVLRSVHPDSVELEKTALTDVAQFEPRERERFERALAQGSGGVFEMKTAGGSQLAALEPLGENDWFVLSIAPRWALQAHYGMTAIGTTIIIAAACLIFLLFLYRLSRLMRKNREALWRLAYDDELLGCRNVSKFKLDAQELTERGGGYAVWYVDIKRFKYINDMFGYPMGDHQLRRLAALLDAGEQSGNIFCRVSADNFAGLFFYRERAEITAWFQRLLEGLDEEERDEAGWLPIEISMGVYCSETGEPLSVNEQLNRAIMAQKSAKGLSGSRLAFFNEEIRRQAQRETEMENRSKQALEQGEFVVYMQPKVDIQRGRRVMGAEALVRWRSPENGLVPPGEFIPLFERNGFIVKLDRYMMEQVCRWLRAYLDAGRPPVTIAVNVSRMELLQEDFISFYTGTKGRFGIPDKLIELEFTESVFLDDSVMFFDTVRQLQENGFVCSLDDFGAGYSSLNLLKRLPIDVLKLDILFFSQDDGGGRERIVVANVLQMARQLRIKTVAEGVETKEQVAYLQEAGCDMVQGYVFARPLPLEEFDALLLAGDTLSEAEGQ